MKRIILGALFALGFGSATLAAPLNPGSVVFPTGTTFADPVHGGVQLITNDSLIDFRMDPTPATITDLGGAIQNRVTERDDGGLNFAPRIRNTFNIDGGIFAIVAMQLTGFGAFDIDAEFRTDGLGDKGPNSYSRSADGDIITVRYSNPGFEGGLVIGSLAGQPQEESLFPSFVTDAQNFALTGTATIFGYLIDEDRYNAGGGIFQDPDADLITVTVEGLAVPAPAVPLPASVLFLAAGLAGLGFMRNKRA